MSVEKPTGIQSTSPRHPVVVGRTPWDFAAEAIRSRTALVIVIAIFLVLPLTIHFLAEPTSEINLFGLIKYKKAAAPPELPKPTPQISAPIPSSYSLPSKLKISNEVVLPILDGTLNVTSVHTEDQLVTCRLGGANLPKTKVGVRQLNGNPAKLASSGAGGPVEVTLMNGCFFEVEYEGHTFTISIQEAGYPKFEVTVGSIAKPTLVLFEPPVR